jgi:glycosyltransferase involved in cell wall biosynthesis
MANTPLVSIVIPCYNSERYIGEAIESALGQTYPNIEVIVIDDGSTDDSASIIQRFLPRIKFDRQPNRGACAARNAGLRLAEGPFVKFNDADDVLVRTVIAAQVSRTAHLAGSNAILFGDILIGDENATGATIFTYEGKRNYNAGDTASIGETIQTAAPLHKRSMLTAVGGFNVNIKVWQEYELHMRMMLQGFRFVYYPDQCVIYRHHQSISRIRLNSRICDFVECLDFLVEFCKTVAISSEVKRHLAKQYWTIGRRALRLGFPEAADECFHKARSTYPYDAVCGPISYRLLVSMLGPHATERVARAKRYFRGAALKHGRPRLL